VKQPLGQLSGDRLRTANSGLLKAEVTIDWAIVTDYQEERVQQ
jgi:hypothetical protein